LKERISESVFVPPPLFRNWRCPSLYKDSTVSNSFEPNRKHPVVLFSSCWIKHRDRRELYLQVPSFSLIYRFPASVWYKKWHTLISWKKLWKGIWTNNIPLSIKKPWTAQYLSYIYLIQKTIYTSQRHFLMYIQYKRFS